MLETCPFCLNNTHSDHDKKEYPVCERKFIKKSAAWHLTAENKPHDETVHVFSNPGANMLIGADWSRSSIKELLERCKHVELCDADGHARRMKHGICVTDVDDKYWFVETDEKLLKDFESIYING